MDPNVKEQKTNGVSQQPVPTVGTVNKEGGVRVEASDQLPKVSEELQTYVKTEEPAVPHEPQVGIMPSAESTPVPAQPSVTLQLPYSEEEADDILKKAKNEIKSSEHLGEQKGEYIIESKFGLATLTKKLRDWARLFGNAIRSLTKKPA